MTGLLYQDFCTAKGKWMLRILAACVLILIGMVIWGDPDGMAGALFLAILGLIAVYYGISIPEKIFASDEKNSIRTFLLSLPTGGRKYVQEKYAFMGIYYYTLANLLVVLVAVWKYQSRPKDEYDALAAAVGNAGLAVAGVSC